MTTATDFETNIAAAIAAEIKAAAEAAMGPRDDGVTWKGMLNRHEQYWRFCPDEKCMKPGHVKQRGWIVVGPSMKAVHPEWNVEAFRRGKHAVALPDYGQYEVGYELHQNASPQLPFGRFTEIVTKPGGIAEFPREQILAYGWHRNPATSAVVRKARPDINDHEDIPCPFKCPGRFFVSEEAKMQHVSAVHEKQLMSESLAQAVSVPMERMTAAVQGVVKGVDHQTIAAITAAVLAALKGDIPTVEPELQPSDEITPEVGPESASELPGLLDREALRRAIRPR